MKRLLIAAIIVLIVFPFTSLATQRLGWSMLQSNAEQRKQARLSKMSEDSSGEYYRLGRSIFQSIGSPRRRRITQVATVSGVADGSIVIMQDKYGTEEIRLLGVDAPAIGECYGQESRNVLRDFVLNKAVTIEREETYQRDSYRRLVRYLRLESQDVNAWMIWNGLAFADSTHEHERLNEYLALEQRAKEEEKGIWSSDCEYNANLETLEVLQF